MLIKALGGDRRKTYRAVAKQRALLCSVIHHMRFSNPISVWCTLPNTALSLLVIHAEMHVDAQPTVPVCHRHKSTIKLPFVADWE